MTLWLFEILCTCRLERWERHQNPHLDTASGPAIPLSAPVPSVGLQILDHETLKCINYCQNRYEALDLCKVGCVYL